MKKRLIPGVGALIIKKDSENKTLIFTQRRIVKNHDYDPLYDQTWEVPMGKMEQGENVLRTLLRECREELGVSNVSINGIFGLEMKDWSTGKGDNYGLYKPFCLVQSWALPQPWLYSFFVVVVDENFQPNYASADGEASHCRWWTAKELKEELKENLKNFMGLCYPALHKLCEAIEKGEI